MYYLMLSMGNLLILVAVMILLPGVVVSNNSGAVAGAIVLTLLNVLLRPILLLMLLPINVLTLGLITLLINTWMVMLMDKLVPSIFIGGFWNALLTGLLIMIMMNLVRRRLTRDSNNWATNNHPGID